MKDLYIGLLEINAISLARNAAVSVVEEINNLKK